MSVLKYNNVYPIIHIEGASGKGTEREPLVISGSPSQYEAFVTGAAESQTTGTLTEGNTYLILSLEAGDNFANVGYVEEGTPFVATGTTPTTYTNSTVVDRKSTRLNSSHVKISYAVFCLKKKTHSSNYRNK